MDRSGGNPLLNANVQLVSPLVSHCTCLPLPIPGDFVSCGNAHQRKTGWTVLRLTMLVTVGVVPCRNFKIILHGVAVWRSPAFSLGILDVVTLEKRNFLFLRAAFCQLWHFY